jgi:hypothetical protein
MWQSPQRRKVGGEKQLRKHADNRSTVESEGEGEKQQRNNPCW